MSARPKAKPKKRVAKPKRDARGQFVAKRRRRVGDVVRQRGRDEPVMIVGKAREHTSVCLWIDGDMVSSAPYLNRSLVNASISDLSEAHRVRLSRAIEDGVAPQVLEFPPGMFAKEPNPAAWMPSPVTAGAYAAFGVLPDAPEQPKPRRPIDAVAAAIVLALVVVAILSVLAWAVTQ